jgi:hypothetical protein
VRSPSRTLRPITLISKCGRVFIRVGSGPRRRQAIEALNFAEQFSRVPNGKRGVNGSLGMPIGQAAGFP